MNETADEEHAAPSRLSQDVLALEKHFKDNLMLLKTRQTEIDRLTSEVRGLQETLRTKDAESLRLKSKISALEMDARRFEQERSKDKLLYQREENKYIQSINELRRSVESRELTIRDEIARRELELEEAFQGKIREMQSKHDVSLSQAQQRLHRELNNEQKIKARLQQIIDENLCLQEKLRQLESKYVSESSVYKTEMASMQSTLSGNSERIRTAQSETQRLRSELTVKDNINNKLTDQLKRDELKINRLSDEYKLIVHESRALERRCAEEREQTKLNYQSGIEKLSEENETLRQEVKSLKEHMQKMQTAPGCGVRDHERFAEICRQNAVLQEIVKAMRKERTDVSAAGESDAERRVERLENLVQMLKRSMLDSRRFSATKREHQLSTM